MRQSKGNNLNELVRFYALEFLLLYCLTLCTHFVSKPCHCWYEKYRTHFCLRFLKILQIKQKHVCWYQSLCNLVWNLYFNFFLYISSLINEIWKKLTRWSLVPIIYTSKFSLLLQACGRIKPLFTLAMI